MHKVLVVGAGGIGQRHILGYLQSGRAEISIVEPLAEHREKATHLHDIAHSFANLEEVNLEQFDMAVICAPAHTHVSLMNACAEANLSFMVEKPLAVNMKGVDQVLKTVAQKNLIARVGYIRRVAEEVKALRAQIGDGKIGDLRLVYANGSQDFPKYRPDFQRTYYANPEQGGGAILDAASHTVDLLIWIMGRPTEVSCMFDRLVLEGTKTEDTCLINLRFQSGAMANITINQFQKRNTSTLEFIGTQGNLQLDHSCLKFSNDDEARWLESHDYMAGLVPMQAHQARFAMQANAMLDAIEGAPCELSTLAEARLNLEVALAAKQSWLEKRIVSLDQ